MIHYSVVPLDMVLAAGNLEELPETVELAFGDITMEVRPDGPREAVIVRLISGNPQHYLDPRYAPGRRIALEPRL